MMKIPSKSHDGNINIIPNCIRYYVILHAIYLLSRNSNHIDINPNILDL